MKEHIAGVLLFIFILAMIFFPIWVMWAEPVDPKLEVWEQEEDEE